MDSPEEKLQVIEQDLMTISTNAKALTISSQEEVLTASSLAVDIKKRSKRVDEIRKFFADPLSEQVKKINAMFMPAIKKYDEQETYIKRLISNYSMEQEKARRDEESRLQLEHEKLMAKQEKKAEKKGETFYPTIAPTIQEAPKTVKAEKVNTTTIIEWRFEIQDPYEIPREYCVPSEALIRAAVKQGLRVIPGVTIYEDVQVKLKAN